MWQRWKGKVALTRSHLRPSCCSFLSLRRGGVQAIRPAFCFSAAPLRLREEEGHSAFWFKLFCAMTTLQGAAAFKGTLQPAARTPSARWSTSKNQRNAIVPFCGTTSFMRICIFQNILLFILLLQHQWIWMCADVKIHREVHIMTYC